MTPGPRPTAHGPHERTLELVRSLCLSLPEVTERLSHGAPTFFVRNKTFVMFHDDHHGDGRLAIWVAAPDGAQEELVATRPGSFFRPAYVGHRGWIGVLLDADVDEAELADLVEEAWRCVAPKRLVAELDAVPPD